MGALAATTGSVMLLSPLRRLCYGAAPIRCSRSLGNGPLACKRAGLMLHDRFLMTESKKPLTILLATPRGFSAGVDRPILIADLPINPYPRPSSLRPQIVPNPSS